MTDAATCRCGLPPAAPLVDGLRNRFEQLIGWAKAGESPGRYYLMDKENMDRLRDDLILAVADETASHRAVQR